MEKKSGKGFMPTTVLFSLTGLLTGTMALALTQRARSVNQPRDPSGSGSLITVRRGDSLQDVLNRSQPGDTIVVEAAAVFRGPFILPNKSGQRYITIQSSRASELAPGVRVSPSQSGLLAKLQSATDGQPIVRMAPGANHYKFIGIEFSTTDASVAVYDLVRFGDSGPAQTTVEAVPHDLVIDRCYIHGFATQNVQRGVTLNSAETTISNSYISDIHGVGYDTQAVCGWNGPGPFHIINNHLEGAGENILFGGADPSIPNLVPSNIEIRRNYVYKPLSWKVGDPSYAGNPWTVKNLLELKNAQNVVIDGNVFENCWTDAQAGYGILFTVRNQDGTAPWSIIRNVQFINNRVKNSQAALNFLGSDDLHPSQRGSNLTVLNNFFTGISAVFLQLNGFYDVRIEHNTHFQSGNIMMLYGERSAGFVYTNNLTIRPEQGYGVFGDAIGEGTVALERFTPGYLFQGNVLIKAKKPLYPPRNFFPASVSAVGFVDFAGGNYRLNPRSSYKRVGLDQRDAGCDFDKLSMP